MNVWKLILAALALFATLTWIAVFATPATQNLQIIACNVGQGDGLLLIQGNNQIVVDGGPNSAIINCIDKHIPFYDRTIELVVMTHPQFDHYRGLIDVFENYDVVNFLTTGLSADAAAFEKLKVAVETEDVQIITPDAGKQIRIGSIVLSVIHPSYDFQNAYKSNGEVRLGEFASFTTDRDPNDFSVIFNLEYGDFDAIFTGDIGPEVMDEIIDSGLLTDIEYLKVPHHGSKNGLTQDLLDLVFPEIAVIQVGSDNRFGHPHDQVLGMLDIEGVKILRTDLNGEVIVESDGKSWWMVE